MHVARRLATINVAPSDNLQTKLNSAGAGDTLNLADGTYTGSGSNVLEISKDITIRAQNSGQAILDGENARRVIVIASGTVTLEGLNITRGYASHGGGVFINGGTVMLNNCDVYSNTSEPSVSACLLNLT